MYSVFIVDDESIVRDGIRSKIKWDATPFVFAGEAADGEIALSMIQDIKPDILITDIKMPFMDGLELSRMAKKLHPWIRIIILSGHDEFEYAKKAISIGVEDYILKPFTSADILQSLTKIAEILNAQKQQFKDISKMKEELESNAMLKKDKLMTDIVLGLVSPSDALQRAEVLQINVIARFYVVIVSTFYPQNGDINILITVKTYLMSFLKDDQDVIGFFIAPDKFVCILKSSDKDPLEDAAYHMADTIQYETEQNMNCFVVTSIGSIVDRTAYITNSYKEAEHIQSNYRSSGKSRILGLSDFKESREVTAMQQENDPLVDRLRFAGVGEIDQIVEQYIELLGNDPNGFSDTAFYLLVDVIVAVSHLIEDLGGDIKNIMPEILTRNFLESAVQCQNVFISEIRNVLHHVLEYRDSKMQGRYGDVILKAKKYIETNYANQDICLRSVAETVNFSSNHFSTIFSQECGITFIEYLTSVRIEQAKKLLANTTMRSADIAYETGFNDPHYFSYIFKKSTGSTPRDYRSEMNQNFYS